MDEKKYAVLIDSENISAKYIGIILDEMTRYGVVTYKRIYGDWTSPQSASWKSVLFKYSLTPIQQFNIVSGKNSTDSALIIDAMDILYTNNVDGFCIVSSDSDFTRLVSRLKESAMEVIGMGESKTPRSFKVACSIFTALDLLLDENTDINQNYKNYSIDSVKNSSIENTVPNNTLYSIEKISLDIIENSVIEIVTENNNKGRTTELGEIGNRLQKKYPDFDVRSYGYSSLSTFMQEIKSVELRRLNNNTVTIRLINNKSFKEKIINFIIAIVSEYGNEGIDLGLLGTKIHNKYPNFKGKEFGYSTLSKFISSIPNLTIVAFDSTRNYVYINNKYRRKE
ncbi:NYN domain-containing protein [Lachnobacterium bovis]|uniref:Uncharacterized conserved protein, LabA/DUF88 family n=1 Tax=Lachnobacterium bovis TaxID=140626 RepID=A0A1H9TW19_9FIRM|nr:NYN domain-containing protein [Lachnobacterium bovis]SES01174.1 Uncharacterized conserved protein, LabA/DUF88 family [Lachnobacterium bovis]